MLHGEEAYKLYSSTNIIRLVTQKKTTLVSITVFLYGHRSTITLSQGPTTSSDNDTVNHVESS